jgi:hypothetical protein
MIPKWSQIDPKFNPPLSPLLTIKIKNRNKIFTWILLITFIYQYCTLHKAYLTYIITNSFLFIYLGLIWNEIKQLWDNGPKEYIRKNTLAYNLIKSNHHYSFFCLGEEVFSDNLLVIWNCIMIIYFIMYYQNQWRKKKIYIWKRLRYCYFWSKILHSMHWLNIGPTWWWLSILSYYKTGLTSFELVLDQ